MDSFLRRLPVRSRFCGRASPARTLTLLAVSSLVWPAMISAQGIRLSGRPMAGDVREFEIATDGERVVYVADQEQAGDIELFSVPVLGGAPPTLHDFSELSAYWFLICEERVVFQNIGGALFSMPIVGGEQPRVLDSGYSDIVGFDGVLLWHGPIYSPRTGRVVYVRWRYEWDWLNWNVEEDLALYSVDVRRGELSLVRLDDLDASPFSPEPSVNDFVIVLDGGDVVFRTTSQGLYRTPIDQESLVQFFIRAADPLLRSSDGARVVYLRENFSRDDELYSLPANGSTGEVLLSPNVSASADFLVSEARNRVVYRDRFELFGVPIDGSSPPVKLNPMLDPFERIESFQLSREGKRVVYLADQDADDQLELFGVPSDGSLAPVQLNDPLPPGGDVSAYSIGSQRVVYLADQEQDERFALYSAPIAPRKIGGGVIKVSGPLVPGGDVLSDFQLTPDGLRVVYRADQDADEVIELYVASLDGTSRPRKLNAPLVRGGDVQSGFRTGFQVTDDVVVYRADQDTDQVFELYASFLSTPAERLRDLTGSAPGIRQR